MSTKQKITLIHNKEKDHWGNKVALRSNAMNLLEVHLMNDMLVEATEETRLWLLDYPSGGREQSHPSVSWRSWCSARETAVMPLPSCTVCQQRRRRRRCCCYKSGITAAGDGVSRSENHEKWRGCVVGEAAEMRELPLFPLPVCPLPSP